MRLDPRRIPLIGNDIAQVGQVYNILSSPCEPIPWIAVQAFFANTPMLVWSLFKPDPVDYVTERIGRPHHKKRKRRFLTMDIDILLPKGKRGIRWAEFRSLKLLERIGWYFLVIDATTDFAVNWTSMAYQFSGCHVPDAPWAHIERNTPFEWFATTDNFQIGGATQISGHIWHASNSTISANTDGPKTISGWAVEKPHQRTPRGAITKIELQKVNSVRPRIIPMDRGDPDENGNRPWSVRDRDFNDFDPGGSYQMRAYTTPGWISVANWGMSGAGTIVPGIEHDP